MQGLPIHAAIILNLPKSYDSESLEKITGELCINLQNISTRFVGLVLIAISISNDFKKRRLLKKFTRLFLSFTVMNGLNPCVTKWK